MAEEALLEVVPETETVEAPEQEQAEPRHRRTNEQIQRDSLIDLYEGKGDGSKLSFDLFSKIRNAQQAGQKPAEVETAYRNREHDAHIDAIRDSVNDALKPLTPDPSRYQNDEVVRMAQQLVADQEMGQLIESHQEALDATRGEHSDFDEVVTAELDKIAASSHSVPTVSAMHEALLRLGPETAYVAAKEGRLSRIARMTPVEAVAALGRISAQLESADDESDEDYSPTRQLHKPPTPVKKVTPIRRIDINDKNLSYGDFVKERNRQIKAKQSAT